MRLHRPSLPPVSRAELRDWIRACTFVLGLWILLRLGLRELCCVLDPAGLGQVLLPPPWPALGLGLGLLGLGRFLAFCLVPRAPERSGLQLPVLRRVGMLVLGVSLSAQALLRLFMPGSPEDSIRVRTQNSGNWVDMQSFEAFRDQTPDLVPPPGWIGEIESLHAWLALVLGILVGGAAWRRLRATRVSLGVPGTWLVLAWYGGCFAWLLHDQDWIHRELEPCFGVFLQSVAPEVFFDPRSASSFGQPWWSQLVLPLACLLPGLWLWVRPSVAGLAAPVFVSGRDLCWGLAAGTLLAQGLFIIERGRGLLVPPLGLVAGADTPLQELAALGLGSPGPGMLGMLGCAICGLAMLPVARPSLPSVALRCALGLPLVGLSLDMLVAAAWHPDYWKFFDLPALSWVAVLLGLCICLGLAAWWIPALVAVLWRRGEGPDLIRVLVALPGLYYWSGLMVRVLVTSLGWLVGVQDLDFYVGAWHASGSPAIWEPALAAASTYLLFWPPRRKLDSPQARS